MLFSDFFCSKAYVNKVKAGKIYQESLVKFNFGSHPNREILHGAYI
jgi:hypothetical protein